MQLFHRSAPLTKLAFEVRLQEYCFWKTHITANLQQEVTNERR
jgi:hypothetical protein